MVQSGCVSVYKNLQDTPGDIHHIQQFKPVFASALYKTEVNVIGKYLSGLLLLKTMPDSSIRLVFSSQTGLTFFDFGFSSGNRFTVNYIMKKMNRKPVITTLRKDFELVLMQSLDTPAAYMRKDSGAVYYVFPQAKGFYCYITDPGGKELLRMERSSKRKPVVEAIMRNFSNGMPDTIGITHKNFNFTIGLKKIER